MNQSKDRQRKLMQAIREMAHKNKKFFIQTIIAKYGVWSSVGACCREMGWLASNGADKKSGVKWVGPIPHSEEELFRMATLLRTAMTDYNNAASRKSRNLRGQGRTDDPRKEWPHRTTVPEVTHYQSSVSLHDQIAEHGGDPAIIERPRPQSPKVDRGRRPEPDYDQLDEAAERMRKEPAKSGQTVSILWGLFKWERK